MPFVTGFRPSGILRNDYPEIIRLTCVMTIFNSLFVLPCRSKAWSVSPHPNSTFASTSGLHPSNSIIPDLREAVSIITPLILSQNPSPKIDPRKRKTWTKAERILAADAIPASSVEHLKELVEYLVRLVVLALITWYTSSKTHTRVGSANRTTISEYCTQYLKGT